jgi:transposase/uncharacterized coiled-coil protein SlyX
MMAVPEELGRLRGEARKLRQENATLRLAHDAQARGRVQLEKKVTQQNKRIKQLHEEVTTLKKEVTELKSRLGLSVDHVKKLAGMIFKSNVKKTAGTGRGTRSGHPGHGRTNPSRVDREIDIFLTHCYDCGAPLKQTASVDEHIVEDIPQTQTVVTRYHIQRQWCACCHKEVRGIPQGTIPGMRFGIGTITLILFLKYRMRAPLAKIEEILLSQHKLVVTGQGIQEILHTLKTRFTTQYNTILEEIRHAPVKHADETGFRIDGKNGWCWLFATPTAALYTIEETRGKGVPERIFGHDPTGVLVRDDYAAYEKLPMEQQSCWSHLLRISHDAAVHEHASEEMQMLHTELKQLFDEIDVITHEPYQLPMRKRHYVAYTLRIDAIIKCQYEHIDAKTIQTRITNQRTNLITAILHANVPLTNNHAERMIRPMVITRKISGGSRSIRGAATHALNMTIVQTLALKGKDFFTGITEILQAGNKRYALGNGG